MFNIRDFTASISERGVARTNRFSITIALPKELTNWLNKNGGGNNLRELSLRADSVEWPGYSYLTYDTISRVGYGPAELSPYAPLFDSVTFTFISDRNLDIYKLFYAWNNLIINTRNRGQSLYFSDSTSIAETYRQSPYELSYKDDYVSNTMQIYMYDTEGDKKMEAVLYRAYPLLLPKIDLSWASENEILRIPIQFSYSDFEVKHFGVPSNDFVQAFSNF